MRSDPDFRSIVTERLALRRSRADDADTISAYRSDPDVHRYQGWDRTDPEGIRQEIERMSERRPGDPAGWVQLSVEERATGALIGDVGLSPTEGEPGVIKLGYTMSPAAQGRGYATEAVTALVAYAFDMLGAEVVRIYADEANVPSIRVAEKAGLHQIERIERSYEGETWFGVRYELRRQDFEPHRPEPGRTSRP